MVAIRSAIRFVLGEETVAIDHVDPTATLLDWLRIDRRKTGTKEGCAEGDCGACTVLVGRIEHGALRYRPVNACIRFLSTMDACHVLTVEHLSAPDGTLHPVQQAMVDHHASQCGFCTPGFVMSLYNLWLAEPRPDADRIERALQGNLCRCTGYEPIVKAGLAMADLGRPDEDRWRRVRIDIEARLQELADGARIEIAHGQRRFVQPADADDLADVLMAHPHATVVAGATDVGLWVTKDMREPDTVVSIAHLDDLRMLDAGKDGITLGAVVSYEDAWPVLAKSFPGIGELLHRLGGEQVRTMGTIGGNIANGSPIGDTPPPFIALGAELTLRRGSERRTIPLEDFFIAYGRQNRAPGEFVESVFVPRLPDNARFAVYKISKRFEEDISAVCGAFRVDLAADGTVERARIAFGGMAGTPARAARAEAALTGRPFDDDAVGAAEAALGEDYSPLTDWRASAEYRSRAARGLLRRFFVETTAPETPVRLKRERRLADA